MTSSEISIFLDLLIILQLIIFSHCLLICHLYNYFCITEPTPYASYINDCFLYPKIIVRASFSVTNHASASATNFTNHT